MNKPIDITGVSLKTERLILRPFMDSDLHDLYEYAKVEGVGEAAGWTHHKSIEESKMILDMFKEEKKTFAIVYEGKVIGSLGIEEYSEKELPELKDKLGRELGYALSKDYWGRGLMKEAVQRVIRYLFEEENLDFLVCSHFMENERSKKTQESCGFKYVKNISFETRSLGVKESCLHILYREEANGIL